MEVAELQAKIYEETGIKTSVKKQTGSMKNYIMISPMFQGGQYPSFPFDFARKMQEQYPGQEPKPNFFSVSSFHVYGLTTDNAIKYKKENKAKQVENQSSAQWGSKNTQLRLDKASSRYAKRLKQCNCARYN